MTRRAGRIGLKLLESVRQMKARDFARVTEVDVNGVVPVRQSTVLLQAESASVLLSAEDEAALLEALAEADGGETISGEELSQRLAHRERP